MESYTNTEDTRNGIPSRKFTDCKSNPCPQDPELQLKEYYEEAIWFYARQYMLYVKHFTKITTGITDTSKLEEMEQNFMAEVRINIDHKKRIGGANNPESASQCTSMSQMELKETIQCPKNTDCNSDSCPQDPRHQLKEYYEEAVWFYARQYILHVKQFIKITTGLKDDSKLNETEQYFMEEVRTNIDHKKMIEAENKLNNESQCTSEESFKDSLERSHDDYRGPITTNEGSHNEEVEVA